MHARLRLLTFLRPLPHAGYTVTFSLNPETFLLFPDTASKPSHIHPSIGFSPNTHQNFALRGGLKEQRCNKQEKPTQTTVKVMVAQEA